MRTRPLAAILAVAGGLLLVGPASAFAQAGFNGTVTAEAGGAPLENAQVTLFDEFGLERETDLTDATGAYSIDLPLDAFPGQGWKLRFRPAAGQNFVAEWAANKESEHDADVFTLGPDDDPVTFNAALATGGRISGTVTGDSFSPGPLEGVCVSAGGAHDTTDASGNYELVGLRAGSYVLQFGPCTAGMEDIVGEYYDDERDPANADPVTVTAGGDVTGRNAVLATAGSISGTVTGSDGQPAQDVCVSANSVDELFGYFDITDADGEYTIENVADGAYTVVFDPCPANGDLREFWNDKQSAAAADTVSVAPGTNTPNINATLALGRTISGTITDAASGDPVTDSCAQAYRTSDGAQVGQAATPDANGDYTIDSLAPGTYKVEFCSPGTYATEFFDDKRSLASADVVSVATANASGVNGELDVGGVVSGAVTDGLTSNPISSACVEIFDAAGASAGQAVTEGDGTYRFEGLNPGNYRVGADGTCAGIVEYPPEFYDDKPTLAAADPVAVTLGNETSGIDFELTPTPTVEITGGADGPTKDSTPTFTFTAEHATPQCSIDTGTSAFGPCTTSSSHTASTPLADGSYTFRVRVQSGSGSETETRAFSVDTVPPDLTITGGPSGLTNDTTPTFTYNPTGIGGGDVLCVIHQNEPTIDDDLCANTSFTPISPLPADGVYVFRAQARDPAGNTSAYRSRPFVLDTVAPEVSITGGPSGPTDDVSPTFEFAADGDAAVSCSIDGGSPAFGPCAAQTSHTPPDLAPGGYVFRVRATDGAGNQSTDTRAFSVNAPPDATGPGVRITSGPKAKTKDTTPTFAFTADEPGASFSCSIDGKAAAACASPYTAKKLKKGKHRFAVVATDGAGNAGAPAERAFTVKKKKKRR